MSSKKKQQEKYMRALRQDMRRQEEELAEEQGLKATKAKDAELAQREAARDETLRDQLKNIPSASELQEIVASLPIPRHEEEQVEGLCASNLTPGLPFPDETVCSALSLWHACRNLLITPDAISDVWRSCWFQRGMCAKGELPPLPSSLPSKIVLAKAAACHGRGEESAERSARFALTAWFWCSIFLAEESERLKREITEGGLLQKELETRGKRKRLPRGKAERYSSPARGAISFRDGLSNICNQTDFTKQKAHFRKLIQFVFDLEGQRESLPQEDERAVGLGSMKNFKPHIARGGAPFAYFERNDFDRDDVRFFREMNELFEKRNRSRGGKAAAKKRAENSWQEPTTQQSAH